MFASNIYIERRKRLKDDVGSGIILLLGNIESPMNYAANSYPFRQDSTFLYFFGLDKPGLAALIDVDEGTETVFGDDLDRTATITSRNMPGNRDIQNRTR